MFTLFFAGHGGVKAGSYYLCTRESHGDRLSASAMALSQIFAILNEASVRQVNVILDSCESGGLVHDLHAVLKPEIVGPQSTVAISLLAASALDQDASETAQGGLLTQELVRCLSGSIALQSNRPYLDLVEVGNRISSDFQTRAVEQTPVVWGLNLYGDGIFAANPHYSESPTTVAAAFAAIPPASELGSRIEEHSEDLWDAYLSLTKGFEPRQIDAILRQIADKLDDHAQVQRFVHGVAGTFAKRASEARDPMAQSGILATAASSLLHIHDPATPQQSTIDLIAQTQGSLADALMTISTSLDSDRYGLLSRRGTLGPISDLYYLPIRISKVLGWAVAAAVADDLLGRSTIDRHATLGLIRKIVDLYPNALVVLSDAQAPYIYTIGQGLSYLGEVELGREILDKHFADLALHRGAVASARIEDSKIFRFMLMRHNRVYVLDGSTLANPANVTAAVLAAGCALGVGTDWDAGFRQLDRHNGSLFVCRDHRLFADEIIRSGMNEAFIIGFGVWRMSDFEHILEAKCLAEVRKDDSLQDPVTQVLATYSSLLYPDRVPYNLACIQNAE